MNRLFLITFTILSIGLLFSCNKSEVLDVDNNAATASTEVYECTKDITFSHNNSQATLRVHAHTEAALAAYSSRNFKLVEVQANETLEEALIRMKIVEPTQGENPDEAQDALLHAENEIASELAFELIKISNPVEGSHYAVSFFHPELNNRASWQYFTHYSTASQNLQEHADIARHSFWRRVYFGLKYRPYSSSNWSVLQNEWRKLSNNQTMSYTRTPCYQYRARVKTKKSSAYTVSFY